MHSVAKGEQWFHCCAEGFAYGMPCHNLYAEAVGYEKRNDFQNCEAEFRIAMKPPPAQSASRDTRGQASGSD